jgi:hypothetical protein
VTGIPVSDQLLLERQPSLAHLPVHAIAHIWPPEREVGTGLEMNRLRTFAVTASKTVSSRPSFVFAGILPNNTTSCNDGRIYFLQTLHIRVVACWLSSVPCILSKISKYLRRMESTFGHYTGIVWPTDLLNHLDSHHYFISRLSLAYCICACKSPESWPVGGSKLMPSRITSTSPFGELASDDILHLRKDWNTRGKLL